MHHILVGVIESKVDATQPRQNSPAVCKKMAIDLNMCEPNGSDLAGHGSHEIVLKLNAPINSQTVSNKDSLKHFLIWMALLTSTLVVMRTARKRTKKYWPCM